MKLVRSPTTSRKLKYKAYKNKLNHLIHIAKRAYYDSKLENAKNDLRTTGKLLNEVINKRKNNPTLPSLFKSFGKTIPRTLLTDSVNTLLTLVST